MPARFINVTCPSCLQSFEVAAPSADELPAELDYDCEVYDLRAEAHGINE